MLTSQERKKCLYIQRKLIILVLQMDSIIIYKLLTVPAAILITTLLVKKFGAFVGGIFAGLPIFSGPTSFFITLEQGTEFSYLSSYSNLIGLLGAAATALIYAWIAYFGGKFWFALPCAILGYFVTSYLLHFLPEFSSVVIVLACCSCLIAHVFLPRPKLENFSTTRPRWIVWVQMLFGTFMVYSITEAAAFLGPQWSGTISCYPVMITVLAPFTHVASGVYTTIAVLRGLAAGWLGTAVFACMVMLTVKEYHISFVYILASTLSCASTVIYSLLLMYFDKKRKAE